MRERKSERRRGKAKSTHPRGLLRLWHSQQLVGEQLLLQWTFVADGHGHDGDVHHLTHEERFQGHGQQTDLGRQCLHRATARSLDEELEARVAVGHDAADELLEHVPVQLVAGELAAHVKRPRLVQQLAESFHVFEV